jgi:hypothetical protein
MNQSRVQIEGPKVELDPRELEILIALVNRAQITGSEAESVVKVKAKLTSLLQAIKTGNGV